MRLRHGTVSGSQKGFTTVAQKCPCCPASASVVYSSSFKPESAPAFSAEAVFHPALTAQAAALFRILFLRNNPKRGPPTLLI
jgi:hypothetical protein